MLIACCVKVTRCTYVRKNYYWAALSTRMTQKEASRHPLLLEVTLEYPSLIYFHSSCTKNASRALFLVWSLQMAVTLPIEKRLNAISRSSTVPQSHDKPSGWVRAFEKLITLQNSLLFASCTRNSFPRV